MKVLEHGSEIGRTLLFLPCTAEPVWAFAETIALLSEQWHVFQVVFDGHEPEEPGDFTSVEQTVDEVTEYLKAHGIARLDAAYGCSLGGACLTRFLALGEIPVGRAIIDGGITPYQLPYLLRKLILARDVLSFKLAANDRIHVRPRYKNAVVINDHAYTDTEFAHHYALKKESVLLDGDRKVLYALMKKHFVL